MEYKEALVSACLEKVYQSVTDISSQLLFYTQYHGDNSDVIVAVQQLLEESFKKEKLLSDYVLRTDGYTIRSIWFNVISSNIIHFTSTIEYFFKDIIRLCLQRSANLRRSGFAAKEISALKLEHFKEMNDLKLHLIEILASEHSKGGLFSDKLKKLGRFLSINLDFCDADTLKSLDNIWHIRNRIAHEHPSSITEYILTGLTSPSCLTQHATNTEYCDFSLSLIKVYISAIHLLTKIDIDALEKWQDDHFLERESDMFPW